LICRIAARNTIPQGSSPSGEVLRAFAFYVQVVARFPSQRKDISARQGFCAGITDPYGRTSSDLAVTAHIVSAGFGTTIDFADTVVAHRDVGDVLANKITESTFVGYVLRRAEELWVPRHQPLMPAVEANHRAFRVPRARHQRHGAGLALLHVMLIVVQPAINKDIVSASPKLIDYSFGKLQVMSSYQHRLAGRGAFSPQFRFLSPH
jgi:hypothetical protein